MQDKCIGLFLVGNTMFAGMTKHKEESFRILSYFALYLCHRVNKGVCVTKINTKVLR